MPHEAVTAGPEKAGRVARVALIGNPNTGKSTLFGALSGLAVRTGNYPGVTVEERVGRVQWQGRTIDLVDLPGSYSLAPRSPDELVAVEALTTPRGERSVDLVVCVASALLLERNLFLVSQLLELGHPVVLAVNMSDVADSRGKQIDFQRLQRQLGIPVIRTAAARRQGLDELRDRVVEALQRTPRQGAPVESSVLPPVFSAAVDSLVQRCDALSKGGEREAPARYVLERALLDIGGAAQQRLVEQYGTSILDEIARLRGDIERECGSIADLESAARYAWSQQVLDGVIAGTGRESIWTERLDQVLTGRWTGLIAFALLMMLVFQIIFTGSKPLMDVCESLQGVAAGWVESWIAPGMLRSLLIDGVIAGAGGVLVFVPQIALLFVLIAILEDCGYIARAAFLSDRLMSLLGLSGKSFLPLISSFGCAVPGIMATRVIENRRDRLVTILIAPLMSCSARLPVYVLLITAFIPPVSFLGGWVGARGMVLWGMYLVGVAVAVPTAWLLRKTLLTGEPAPFVLELPEYKIPDPRVVLYRAWEAIREFIARAGTLIFAASVLIWAAGYFPGDHTREHALQAQLASLEDSADASVIDAINTELHVEGSKLLETSYLGRLGKGLEPVVRPLGWDWKIGVGALASFPAREVIIATLGTIYSLGSEMDDENQQAGLIAQLSAARWPDGRPVYTIAVALSVMVFFALCAQCVSTLLVMRRETNSWRWPVFSFVYMTTLAYFGAMLTYHVASALGF